ncbi:protein-export chaperone SecB [Marinihelvus fidelis]|uniref:Protein-export protein SecB n=1 Tax=Marinihelvus fidelis TaxID=2613842 RepID=A0A5N0TBQ6_9GAMM|nr:protein-export chaperone SecB [Marinihelvus fidelis]KAA9131854.1 protein-export chaperone SecB [Marinihelvus fidelis]
MAEEQNEIPAAAAEQPATGARFQLQKLYVKDVSFEVPGAPQVFQEEGAAEIKLNLAQRVNNVGEGLYEVVLSVTVTATSKDKTAYLAEVHQAGLFGINGLEEAQLQAALNTLCPHSLFPYAARTITGLVADGGFPPLVLQPINFDHVYQQRLQEAQMQQAAGDIEAGNA